MDTVAQTWSLSRAEWVRANTIAYGFAVAAAAIVVICGGLYYAFLAEFEINAGLLTLLVVFVMIVLVAVGALLNSLALALPLTALASRLAARSAGRVPAAALFAAAGFGVGIFGTLWPFALLVLFDASVIDGSSDLPPLWIAALPIPVIVAALYFAAWAITMRRRTLVTLA